MAHNSQIYAAPHNKLKISHLWKTTRFHLTITWQKIEFTKNKTTLSQLKHSPYCP